MDTSLDLTPQFFKNTHRRVQFRRVGRLENALDGQRGGLLAAMTGGPIPDHTIEVPLFESWHQVFLTYTLDPVLLEVTSEGMDAQLKLPHTPY